MWKPPAVLNAPLIELVFPTRHFFSFTQRNALRATMAAFIEAVEAGVDEHRLCGTSGASLSIFVDLESTYRAPPLISSHLRTTIRSRTIPRKPKQHSGKDCGTQCSQHIIIYDPSLNCDHTSETDQLLQAAFDRGMEQMAREMEPLLRDEAEEFKAEAEVAADAADSASSLTLSAASASGSGSSSSEHGSGKGVRFSGDAAADSTSGLGDDAHAGGGSTGGSSHAKREFRRIATLVAGAERVLGGLQRPKSVDPLSSSLSSPSAAATEAATANNDEAVKDPPPPPSDE